MQPILLIDDNDDYRESLFMALEGRGLDVYQATCPHEAYELLETIDDPALIVCDLHMPFTFGPDQDQFMTSFEVGVKTVQELQWVYPNTIVVALTSLMRSDLERVRLVLAPIPAYSKPSSLAALTSLVEGLLESSSQGGMN